MGLRGLDADPQENTEEDRRPRAYH